MALLRFASPVPNATQNYLFGLTRIHFVPFALTSFVFTVPQVVLYVYFGSTGRAILLGDGSPAWNRVIPCVGLASIVAAMMLIIRRIRRDDLFTEAAVKKP